MREGVGETASSCQQPINTDIMEYLNRVELHGVVGSVMKTKLSECTITRFTVATNYVYKAADGTIVEETTWHTIVSWEDIKIEKGDKVEVVGRIRCNRYTTVSGEEMITYEILASEVRKAE